MNIGTLDLETENYSKFKRKASPFDMRNYIVQIGWSVNGGQPVQRYYDKWHRDPVLPDLTNIDMIVGFNIKFDLLWVWHEEELTKFFEKGGTIYCGQYAEYLLNGMNPEYHMCSMNQIIESYGGSLKIDAVKEMWEDGVMTSEVPRDLLTDYLIGDGKEIDGDINNTWKIFVGQVKRMNEEMAPEFKTMLKFRMDGLLATTEMEYNGLYVNMEVAERNRVKCLTDLEEATKGLEEFIPELPPELEFSWSSPQKKSCLIFGGTVSYKKWKAHEEDGKPVFAKKTVRTPLFTYNGRVITIPLDKCVLAGSLYVYKLSDKLVTPRGVHVEQKGVKYLVQDRFKGGKNVGLGKFRNTQMPDETKPKGKLTDFYFKFDGFVKPKKRWKGEATDAYDQPLYSVSADVVEELGKMGVPFTDALSKYSALSKTLGTYYMIGEGDKAKGMMTLVNDEGVIHHKLNHTSTVTSRLSSSDPKHNWGL